ncbi:hypothetical protein IYR97_23765 (plasmid) [Pseudomonas fulva]|uniref:Uncharacterized protein n=2 Tax=Pseudomonas putida group TaxID=136845 RepID=A0ABD7BPG8_PSEPU|nr:MULTISPECIES: hypothetical protein [Pseudomonas putida group]QOD01540.1 hypothetical protein ID616_30425 [Pseudomonas putida]QPH46814.1 hypothetical protein IYR97_23765 [Pseudomonas fulva]QPH51987.1 hypothetical protein IZU98_24215 [Pseudomonas fulva]
MTPQQSEIDQLVAKLRLDHSDDGGPSRIDFLRERQAAADLIEALVSALGNAESTCEKALAGFSRWESGHPFDPSGPEAEIKGQLYDVIRPGARAGFKKLAALMSDGAAATSRN